FNVQPSADVLGGAGGARIEVGHLHLGLAGHRGRGLGVAYFLDGSDANFAKDTTHELRTFSGAYVQAQVVAGKFDLNGGWGMTWIEPLAAETSQNWCGGGTVAIPCGRCSSTSGRNSPGVGVPEARMGSWWRLG